MTAPNYTDKDEVNGVSKEQLKGFSKLNYGRPTMIAEIALALWDARDSARETAALQDKAIHKALPRTYALEEVAEAARSHNHPFLPYSCLICAKLEKLDALNPEPGKKE